MIPLAVFGNPIAHSLSPQLHSIFAQQADIRINYRAILSSQATFRQQVNSFFAEGGVGANVTLPNKIQALELAEQASDRARLAGAANTLYFRHGRLSAENTDGIGLVRDLNRLVGSLTGISVLILGAGGAVRGILHPLLDAGCASIVLYNRTQERAMELVERADDARLTTYQESDDNRRFDIVINAISAGHQGGGLKLSKSWLNANSLAYDLSYGAASAYFLNNVRALFPHSSSQCELADGLGMLVGQGAESFKLWTGRQVDNTLALQELRLILKHSV